MSSTNIIPISRKPTRRIRVRRQQAQKQFIRIRDAINGLKYLGETNLARRVLEEELNDMRIERHFKKASPARFRYDEISLKHISTAP